MDTLIDVIGIAVWPEKVTGIDEKEYTNWVVAFRSVGFTYRHPRWVFPEDEAKAVKHATQLSRLLNYPVLHNWSD